MSFRTRLLLFFVLIVIVPMISLTVVLFRLIADNENGKADAGVGARQDTAVRLVGAAREAAREGAQALGRDVALATALQRANAAAASARAEALLVPLGLKRVRVTPAGAGVAVDVGSRTAVFPSRQSLRDAAGRPLGTLEVSAQGPKAYAEGVKRVTGVDIVVRRDGRTLAATSQAASAAAATLPAERGDVELDGSRFRVSTFPARSFAGSSVTVSLLSRSEGTSASVRDSRLVAGGILLGFFVLAFGFAVLVSRSLQRQIANFLEAAKRLGAGDFSAKVPTTGRDELAELGDEFNRMSAQLEQRLEDLRAEQARVAEAMRRTGETFAANLDRDGLLEIVLRTALDGAAATGGRAGLRDGEEAPLRKVAVAGSVAGLEAAVFTAEAEALGTDAPAVAEAGGAHALAHPLRPVAGEGTVSGVVSIARSGRPFTPSERELFEYLARQAAVSIENVGLHETVERQAVTDELTGLANRRRFQETLGTEVERSRRFEAPVALVMLDIDNFKRVNDTHGHQTGDLVLREVGRIVRESSREVDTPARYGGEELAMVLPGTDLEGAFNLAERVRQEVGALRLALPDGGTLQVTASFGAATHPDTAEDGRGLVAAADEALYEAKRTGKDRTVVAPQAGPA